MMFSVWYDFLYCDLCWAIFCASGEYWDVVFLMLLGNLRRSWVTEGPNYAFMAYHT